MALHFLKNIRKFISNDAGTDFRKFQFENFIAHHIYVVSDVHLNGMWQLGFKRKIKFVSFKVQHPDCNILDQSGNFWGGKTLSTC